MFFLLFGKVASYKSELYLEEISEFCELFLVTNIKLSTEVGINSEFNLLF